MPKNTSFLPEDYLEKQIVRRTNLICISLFIIVMICVIGAYFVTGHESSQVRIQEQKVNERFSQAAKRLEQLQNLQDKKQQMIEKAQVTSALVEKIPRSTMLAELINNMPTKLSLLTLNLDTKTISPPHPRTALQRAKQKQDQKEKKEQFKVVVPKTNMTVTLVGVAPTDVAVSQYMSNLSNRPMFQDVSLLYSEQTKVDGQTMRQFGIRLTVNQNLNLHDVKLLKVARKLKQNPMSGQIQITAKGIQPPNPNNALLTADEHK